MCDYYLYYFGGGQTEPALYRINKLTGRVTYAILENKVLNFVESTNSKKDILTFYKDFIKLI